MFGDAPPTGAPAGRFDKLEPSPENDVAVITPVTTTPVFAVSSLFEVPENNLVLLHITISKAILFPP